MTLLLDTHVLLWWFDIPGRLSAVHEKAIEAARDSGDPLGVSAVTLWEIAKLVEYRRLSLNDPIDVALDRIERHPDLMILPLDGRVAAESTRLGDGVPKDLADQLIVATARVHGLQLVTADENIRRSGAAPVV